MRDGYAEDVSLLYSEHILVAMCAERNAGLAGRPYRLLLIFRCAPTTTGFGADQ